MRLVLCDDHQLLLDALASALTDRGHVVEAVVSSSAAAVDAVVRADPDACLLDIRFPDGDGVEVARQLRELAPRTKVVILSATADPGTVAAAVGAGVAAFSHKDQSIDAIVHVLDRVMDGEIVIEVAGVRESSRRRDAAESDVARMLRYLTTRELEVLHRLVDGESTEGIAREIGITANTARTHVQNILIKLGAHSRLQAAAMVVNAGWPGVHQASTLRRSS
jgi:two-component system, NarL family, nitrate/nitrite response regulator NarL